MKQEEILFFLASACIVVFAWIAFTIVHNSLTSTIGGTVLQAISPIDATFDTKTLSLLKQRTVINPLYTIQQQSQTDIVVSTAPTQTPVASESGNVASQGGLLQ